MRYLYKTHYKELGKETAYASLFITNHLFVRDSGYFATETASKLLLHTWTLGVEWQFYLLLPLLLAGIWRFGARYLRPLILLLTLISLALSIFGAIWRPEAAFFLLPSRAWEFLLGTLLVLYRQRIKQARLGHWPASCGFILLLACIGLFDERLAYPGYWALLPTLATALMLMTPGGLLSR
ncbi:MAG: acyltransferase family protein, partial [Aeromonadaceae bacterium]